jgi:hypothetical protein
MNTTQAKTRIHPLMAGAAVSVTLVSLLGMAAITGILPNSNAVVPVTAPLAASAPAQVAPEKAVARPTAVKRVTPAPNHVAPTAQAAPRANTPAPVNQRLLLLLKTAQSVLVLAP